MTSESLGEMFEGDSEDTCIGNFVLTSMVAEHEWNLKKKLSDVLGIGYSEATQLIWSIKYKKYISSLKVPDCPFAM